MKRIAAAMLAACAFACAGAHAQTTTITASHIQQDLSGTPLASGYFLLTPVNAYNQPTGFASGAGGQVLPRASYWPITAGAISGVIVPDTADTVPAHIGYQVIITDSNKIPIYTFGTPIYPTGSTWSFDAWSPTVTVQVSPPTAVSSGTQAPTGACTAPSLYYYGTSIYMCVTGSWALMTGAGTNATSLQGVAVSATAPTNGQALLYNSGTSSYVPGTVSGGGITAMTGDVSASGAGSVAATVTGVNGVNLAGLATGLLKNTTGTGAPAIAAAGTDYAMPAQLPSTIGATAHQWLNSYNAATHTFLGSQPGFADLSGTASPSQLPVGSSSALGALQCGSGTSCSAGVISVSGGGGSMTWPASAGIMVYGGSNAYGTSLAAPAGAIVGTTDTQALTNKTLDGVTPTVMGYLDATSSIQTQLNAKSAAVGNCAVETATFTASAPGCYIGNASSGITATLPAPATGAIVRIQNIASGTVTASYGSSFECTVNGSTTSATTCAIANGASAVATTDGTTWYVFVTPSGSGGFPITLGSTSVAANSTTTTLAGLTLTSPTLTTPALGTPASGVATNLTGLPLTTGVTGQLPIANGGTGTSSPGLVAGTNVTVTGTWPNQTIAASGGGSALNYWGVNPSNSNESIAGNGNANQIYAGSFIPPQSVTFSNIYAQIATADSTGLYSLAIANASGVLVCHPTTGAHVVAGLQAFPCSEGSVTLSANTVYILLTTGTANTGMLSQAYPSGGFFGMYENINQGGCTSSSGVISGTCTVSGVAPKSEKDLPAFWLH